MPSSSLASAPGVALRADWFYEVRFDGAELVVEGTFDAHHDSMFSADDDAAPYFRQVEISQGDSWTAVTKVGTSWRATCPKGCRLRYRFALKQACTALAEADTAIASGNVFISPPSTWLLHPGGAAQGATFELHVDPGNAQFVTALQPVSSAEPRRYLADTSVLDDASFAAFGGLQVTEVPAGDATVQLGVAPERLGLSLEQASAWISDSAGAVANFYRGHLPARHALVLLMRGSGGSTRGITLGGGGAGVLVRSSDQVNPKTTRDDWVTTHELFHANFPDIGRGHAWFTEGMATYLEPIARARVGLVSEAKLWRDLVDGLPQGLPEAGDQGLEHTRTWGRTYWGGALFCFVADVTLRERTSNQHTLDDVLLAIGKTGASDQDYWPIQRVLDAATNATGTPVLQELYARLAEKPGTVDLPGLFARLGVRVQGASVVFDDAAPLAKLRRSIAARSPG